MYVLDAFSAAEACLCKWQVGGDTEDDGVVEAGCEGVKAAYRCGAGWGIDAWEDVQDFALAGECLEGGIGEVFRDERESGCGGSDCWKGSCDIEA
jgi:hypothetical protein